MQLDNSMLSTFCQCNWKYALRYELDRKATNVRVSTEVGTSTHAVCDTLLSGNPIYPTILAELDRLKSLSDGSIDGNQQAEHAQQLFYSAVSQLTETYSVVVSGDTKIIMYSPKLSDGKRAKPFPRFFVKYHRPEISFQVPLNERHVFMGKMDAVVQDGNGSLFILELKTSAHANNILWRDKWRLDTQPRGYTWAVSQHTNLPIAGVLIIPISVLKNRCEMTAEIELTFSPVELENWKNNTIQLFDQIEKSQFPPTGMYAGNCINSAFGRCDYFNFCRSNYKMGILEESTIESKWSPIPLEVS